MSTCAACGMAVPDGPHYHPYMACLMFRACGDGEAVRANLAAVLEYGAAAERTWIRREMIDVIADHREAAALSRRLGAEMDRTEREIGADEAFTLVLAALDRIIPEAK